MRKASLVVVMLLLAFLAMHVAAHPLAEECPCVLDQMEIAGSSAIIAVEKVIEASVAPIEQRTRSSRELAVFGPRPPPAV